MIVFYNAKNRISADTQRFLLSSILANIITLITNLATARLLGPYWTGICLSLMVMPQVAGYLNLGLIQTLKVEIPRLGNQPESARSLSQSVFTLSILLSLGVFVAVTLYALLTPGIDPRMRLIVVAAGVLVFFDQTKNFLSVSYAANKRFVRLSWFEFAFALVLIAPIGSIYLFHVEGYWIGMILAYALIIAAGFFDKNRRGAWIGRIDFARLKGLLPLGLSLVFSTVVYTPFMVVAKLFLAFSLGPETVGFFLLSIIVLSKFDTVIRSISGVLMPHLSGMHAESGNLVSLLPLFFKAQTASLLSALVVVGLGTWLIGPLVDYVLPQYVAGVPAAKIMLLACIPYALLDNANTLLIVSRNKSSYFVILSLAFAVQFVILAFFSTHDFTVVDAARAYAWIFAVYALLIHARVFHLWMKERST